MRTAVIVLCALALLSCSRDPNVVKARYLENGNKYFERGRYKEASIMYRNALSKDRLYGMAHYKLGLTYLKLSRPAEAAASLRRGLERIPETQPEHWDAAIRLADIYIAYSRDKVYLDEADEVARKLLARDPNSYDGHRIAAQLAFVAAQQTFAAQNRERGKELLAVSIAEFRKADAVKPDQPVLRSSLARALAADQQFAAAEAIYQRLLAQNKNLIPAYTELYQVYLYENKLDEAEGILKSAVANNPRQYALLALLAAHYYGRRQTPEMVKVLDQIKSNAKDYPQAYQMAGDFYLRVGNGDEAVRQYREGLQKDPGRKLEYQKRIVEVLMRQGKKVEAAELNAQILKDRPKDTDARGLAASLLLDKGDISRAIAELQGVVNAAPDNFVARFHLGRAHMARHEWEQARQQFTAAINLRPDYIHARLALAQLQVTRHDFEAALKTIQDILRIDHSNIAAHLIESAALMGQRKYGESRELLQAMLKGSPNSPDLLFQRGVVNLVEGKYKDAEDDFRKAYQLNPANSRGLIGVVETYMAQNKPEQALQLLQAEAQRYPDKLDYRLALGNTAVRAGKYDLAITQYQAALEKTEKRSTGAADLYLRLGETYRRKHDVNSSIAALQQARQIMPENAVVVATLALTLDGAGRKQEARLAYEQTLKLKPDDGISLNNLAFLYAENGGDLDQALTYAQRAKQFLPNLAEVSDTLGWIYLKKNLSDNAIQIFSDLVKREPNQSTYRYHLGMALSQKGDKPRALKELEQALKSNPPREESAKIRDLIAKIG